MYFIDINISEYFVLRFFYLTLTRNLVMLCHYEHLQTNSLNVLHNNKTDNYEKSMERIYWYKVA